MNRSAAYHSLDLPWTLSAADERRFKNILWAVLAVFLAIGVLVPWVDVPEIEREEAEALPPRLAKLIIEKKKEPPPPVEEVKKEEEPKPEEKKPDEPKKEAAREKAEKSGLMTMRNELAELRKNPALESLTKDVGLLLGGQNAITDQRAVITSNVSRGSGGVQGTGINRNIGVQSLAGVATTRIESPIGADAIPDDEDGKSPRKKARTIEEIQLVFDRNKGAVFSLYHRALRSDPTLQGQVVLEITVTPAGEVADCKVVSSDLEADDFLRKLVARVKLFDFGTRNVDTMVVTYPIDFLPSS